MLYLGVTGKWGMSVQGAVKHGRGNAYCTPDLCVMRGPPFYVNKKIKNT